MNLAFTLIKYFPFGGLQRDFFRIAEICHRRGHQIDVYTPEWSGEVPGWLNLNMVAVDGFTNHARRKSLALKLARAVTEKNYDAVIGFSKMPGLDLYYAADSCFAAKIAKRSLFYRMSGRCRSYIELEKAVFGKDSATVVMMISENEKCAYQDYYQTPDERVFLLPPGISRDRLRPVNAEVIKRELRTEIGIEQGSNMVLMVGSGFKTKGADRALLALAALPEQLLEKTIFVVIGKDNFKPFRRLAERIGISEKVLFFAGRTDITRFLVAADLLIHPAYKENTGTVLIEAMAAQLPVLVTDICGYSGHIEKAGAGLLIPSPFKQETLNSLLREMLQSERMSIWRENGRRYVNEVDVFSMPERAATIIEQTAAAKMTDRTTGVKT